MSPKLEELLRSAGWRRERHVSTTEWVKMLEGDGFELIPEAEKVMAGFGGLTLRYNSPPHSAFQPPVVFLIRCSPAGKEMYLEYLIGKDG